MTLCQLFYNLFLELGYVGQACLHIEYWVLGFQECATTPWFPQDLHVIPLNLAAESLGLRKADFNWKGHTASQCSNPS